MFNDIFTFYIGRDQASFNVHVDVVAQQSRALQTMMRGHFRESADNCAKLPEVESKTFADFLAYAYFISNSVSARDPENTQRSQGKHVAISKILELLLDKGHKTFLCKSCRGRSELRFATHFPICRKCDEDIFSRLRWGVQCIVQDCGKEAGYLQGLMCESCLSDLEVLGWRSLASDGAAKIHFPDTLELGQLQNFRFDVPFRVQDVFAATADVLATLPLPFTDLLGMAKLAVFAEIYEVDHLLRTTSMALYGRLARENLNEESISTVTQITGFIYQNTVRNHILRKMLSEFIAAHRGKFLESQHFIDLLAQGGDLPSDVLRATTHSRSSQSSS